MKFHDIIVLTIIPQDRRGLVLAHRKLFWYEIEVNQLRRKKKNRAKSLTEGVEKVHRITTT